MEKREPYGKCTIGGRTNGTAKEVTKLSPQLASTISEIKRIMVLS